ncbi:MAG TPA: hypothetical protein VE959_33555 [Bryobacteraceae bacterium]|nr:hypothetical protein [Bryobacteraceae bacterium]
MGVKHGKPPVDLHIEELVLHGFSPGDRLLIGDAIERELARLAWTAGHAGSRSVGELDVGEFRLERGWKARDAGRHIARAVGRGLAGPRQQRGSNR